MPFPNLALRPTTPSTSSRVARPRSPILLGLLALLAFVSCKDSRDESDGSPQADLVDREWDFEWYLAGRTPTTLYTDSAYVTWTFDQDNLEVRTSDDSSTYFRPWRLAPGTYPYRRSGDSLFIGRSVGVEFRVGSDSLWLDRGSAYDGPSGLARG